MAEDEGTPSELVENEKEIHQALIDCEIDLPWSESSQFVNQPQQL